VGLAGQGPHIPSISQASSKFGHKRVDNNSDALAKELRERFQRLKQAATGSIA